jgi:hypothetical protein
MAPKSTFRREGEGVLARNGKAFPDWNSLLEPLLFDTSLFHVVLPISRGVNQLVSGKGSSVKVCIVPRHTSPKLFPFPYNSLDIVGYMLVNEQCVHVAVGVQEGIVERSECFEGRSSPVHQQGQGV